MRKIKFRLRVDNKIVGYEKWYSGDRKEFRAKPCWLYSKDGKYWNPNYIFHTHKDQYTNLKDKKGKEIFEGHIVKNYFGLTLKSESDGEREYDGEPRIIKIIDIRFLKSYMIYEGMDMKDVEIIGHMYENKESEA